MTAFKRHYRSHVQYMRNMKQLAGRRALACPQIRLFAS